MSQRTLNFRALFELQDGSKEWRFIGVNHFAGDRGDKQVSPWLQFAGFKDMRGFPVYEGDIVTAWSAGSKANFQVKWRQNGSPCFILFPAWQNREFWHIAVTEAKKGDKFIGVDGATSEATEDSCYDDGLEVIGNIYENPELIVKA